MQTQELNSLTNTDLERMRTTIDSILETRKNKERNAAIEQIKALAGQAGISVTIREDAAGSGAKSNVAPRYRNPSNANETWSGRGRAPKWLVELEAKGTKRTDCMIARP